MRPLRFAAAALTVLATSSRLGAQEFDISRYDHLRDPQIVERPAETMLDVEATGDPNVIGAPAFGLVFQLYFSLPDRPAGFILPIPRARWPVDLDAPQSTWVGHYGIGVQKGTELPPHSPADGLTASITTWEYGEVAEILHIGRYDAEQPTFERLNAFIEEEGYETIGGHEEEYLRGPTMAGPGNPDEYVTILRYRVRKAGG